MHSGQLSKQFLKRELPIVLSALILFFIAGTIHQRTQRPAIVVSKQDSAVNINKNLLLYFSLGNKRLLADLIWIQTLLESDEEHYSKMDLNSWMYHRFMSISILDPHFYENYLYGGMYLSIVKDDVVGAAEVFERGLKLYPSDYKLNYYTGFNYYFEQGNFEKGLTYLEKIQHHPDAAPFVKLIVNKLKYQTTGNYEVTLDFLKHEYNETKDEALKRKLYADIYALQAEHDLKCLNQSGKGCNKVDLEGNAYRLKDGKWEAAKEFTPYKIHRR